MQNVDLFLYKCHEGGINKECHDVGMGESLSFVHSNQNSQAPKRVETLLTIAKIGYNQKHNQLCAHVYPNAQPEAV